MVSSSIKIHGRFVKRRTKFRLQRSRGLRYLEMVISVVERLDGATEQIEFIVGAIVVVPVETIAAIASVFSLPLVAILHVVLNHLR